MDWIKSAIDLLFFVVEWRHINIRNMDKKTQGQFEKKLKAEKSKLTRELKTFAKKDPKIKGNWLTRFPFFGAGRSHPDEKAEEREEYENLLPIEYSLETRLRDIDEALGRIKNGTYGRCANCNKEIRIKRLKIVPKQSCARDAEENNPRLCRIVSLLNC